MNKCLKVLVFLCLPLSLFAQLPYWTIQSQSITDNWAAASVAISEQYAVYGSFQYENEKGAVAFFQFENDEWVDKGLIQPQNSAEGDWFGLGLALDGNQLLVGAPTDNFVSGLPGKAYIFELQDGEVVDEQILAPNINPGDAFGLIGDIEGDLAVVGAPDANNGNGAAVVYRKINGIWEEEATFTLGAAVNPHNFGASVSISGDWIVVGGYETNPGGGGFRHTAYIYKYENGVWNITQVLEAAESNSSATTPNWNSAVSNTELLFGFCYIPVNNNLKGGAIPFSLDDEDDWQPGNAFSLPGLTEEYLGRTVSLEGKFGLVGYYGFQEEPLDSTQLMTIWQNSGPATWTELGRFRLEDNSGSIFSGIRNDVSGDFAILGDFSNAPGNSKAYILDLRSFGTSSDQEVFSPLSVRLSPNPVSDLLTIESKEQQIQSWQIFDASGKVLAFAERQSKVENIDVSAFAAGLYYLQIRFEGGGEVLPFVVER
ncbi:MAG: T9SS type A sorting domain-containing protein [Bacteroidetes bacterium]|nr:T9SS type A sorting domain-containing protein [Bacteroidota bacterium]